MREDVIVVNSYKEAIELGTDYIDYVYIIDCFSDINNYVIYKNGNVYNRISKADTSIETILDFLE